MGVRRYDRAHRLERERSDPDHSHLRHLEPAPDERRTRPGPCHDGRARPIPRSGRSNHGIAMIRGCLVMTLLVWVSMPAGAKTDPLADGLRRCASETDQAKRLACFDALVATLPKIEADQFG